MSRQMLNDCIDQVLPVLTNIINLSLTLAVLELIIRTKYIYMKIRSSPVNVNYIQAHGLLKLNTMVI